MSATRIVMEYKIVSCDTASELEVSVNELIAIQSTNWEPHGALTRIVTAAGCVFYLQPMVRVDYLGGDL